MKLRVILFRFEGKEYAKPACRNSERACRLVKRPFLTGEEVKLFELLGFRIEVLRTCPETSMG